MKAVGRAPRIGLLLSLSFVPTSARQRWSPGMGAPRPSTAPQALRVRIPFAKPLANGRYSAACAVSTVARKTAKLDGDSRALRDGGCGMMGEALLERMVRAIVDEADPEQVILFGSRAAWRCGGKIRLRFHRRGSGAVRRRTQPA